MRNNWIWMAAIACLTTMSAPSVAEACGTFIPIEGETASLDAQRVIMGYFPEENRTRVVAQIGFVGELTDFSWIIPLPSEPTAVDAVSESGAQLFAQLDERGAPEFSVIDWTCALNNGGGGEGTTAPGVKVLQHGNAGTFEYVVLTGTGGSVVTEWLNAEGYSLPDGMEEVVHTYIREGSVFMAMKVNLEALELGQIDPAISFDYEGWPGYPLRILKPTTTEEIDIILNVVAPMGAETPDEVVLDETAVVWNDREPQYLAAVRGAGNWVVESRRELEELDNLTEVLGFEQSSGLVLTRLHGIFGPDELNEDATINMNPDADSVSSYFSTDVSSPNADCDWDDEGGDDGDDPGGNPIPGQSDDRDTGGSDSADNGGCSTTSGDAASPLFLLLGLGLLRRRRR